MQLVITVSKQASHYSRSILSVISDSSCWGENARQCMPSEEPDLLSSRCHEGYMQISHLALLSVHIHSEFMASNLCTCEQGQYEATWALCDSLPRGVSDAVALKASKVQPPPICKCISIECLGFCFKGKLTCRASDRSPGSGSC